MYEVLTEFVELVGWYLVMPLIYLTVAFAITVRMATIAVDKNFMLSTFNFWEASLFAKFVFVFFVIPFVLFDWAVNMTVMTVLCLELPGDRTEVVTERMKRYKRTYGMTKPYKMVNRWRREIAFFLCSIANSIAREHC